MKSNSMLVHRLDILAAIKALHLTQVQMDHILKEDSYSCGYREGFDSALLALAQVLGVIEELEEAKSSTKSFRPNGIPMVGKSPT